MKVWPPAAAGQFYPKHPDRLRAEVAQLLADVPSYEGRSPKALIAPHAGYMYSGHVAAKGFALLRGTALAIERVVVIGPAHYVPVPGIVIPTADAFETPLGLVPVDRGSLATIAGLPFMISADAPHAPEHALEFELPFLQMLLKSFAVVPLLVGKAEPKNVAYVLRRLWGGPETLIIVSSDLSHYHDYETAQRLDAVTANAIERHEWGHLGPNDACGFRAIAGMLVEARSRNLRTRRLALCNSGDMGAGRSRVVGYGAWSFDGTAARR